MSSPFKFLSTRFTPWVQILIPHNNPSPLPHLRFSSTLTKSFGPSTLLLSPAARSRLKRVLGDDPSSYLRVSVEGGGCSGFQYKFEMESEARGNDDVLLEDVSQPGCRVVVDKSSLEILKGAKIDFENELIRQAFKIVDIPAAEQGCSCGASFNIKS